MTTQAQAQAKPQAQATQPAAQVATPAHQLIKTGLDNAPLTQQLGTLDYPFKAQDKGTKPYELIQSLLASGKLSKEEVEESTSEKNVPRLKRVNVAIQAMLPFFNIAGFTKTMNDNLNRIVHEYIRQAGKDGVDNCSPTFPHWADVLDTEVTNGRNTFSAERNEKAVVFLSTVMESTSFKSANTERAAARELLLKLAKSRFSGASTKGIEKQFIERFKALFSEGGTFYKASAELITTIKAQADDDKKALRLEMAEDYLAAVNTVWLPAIQDILDTEVTVSLDAFAMD